MGGGKDNAAVAGLKHTFCGAAAGAITKTSVAPLERVKIIMQVHGMKDGGTAEKLGIMSTGRVSTGTPRPQPARSRQQQQKWSLRLRERNLAARCLVRWRRGQRAVGPAALCRSAPRPNGLRAEVPHCCLPLLSQRVVAEEGVLALWRSNGVNCLRIIPVYSLKFVSSTPPSPASSDRRRRSSSSLSRARPVAGLAQHSLL